MRGVYIHIPFCQQICYYCDFNKVFLKNQPVDQYIESIGKEFHYMKEAGYSFDQVETVFLGGGTPTALNVAQLDRLLTIVSQYIDVTALKEFTTEANPDDLSEDQLVVLKEKGVNRLSIGVQTFNERLLKQIGRTHSNEDVERVIAAARKIGFDNISIDLMYGLPTQTAEEWEETLDRALSLDLPHYSAYSLIVEPKTVFYNRMVKGKLPLPGEDIEAEMFAMVMDRMNKKGLNQYEISNFAKSGYPSFHNLIYWENSHYAGIGAGAHGYLGKERYANVGPLTHYIDLLEDGKLPRKEVHEVTQSESMEEEMFLGLRIIEGVSMKEFEEKFKRPIREVFGKPIEELQRQGLLQITGDHLQLTRKGIFQGNTAFQEFLLDK
ncbi:coproporphyrinogen III oxidase [Sporosarcina sp. P37]|uniref:radical SAM family heme chaperone HemW n=1 Tax=unclassified Sporosarcina TaxID=2647733 RepID=UPI000A17D121|nr:MULTISPECIES: radical SAM family heme chaperone HemW [unclassified Sporosarcina]ARK26084.1 coproporphyrinogen III oxidase [Sporosarcina sp. P37]PID19453.1 coproporphyrinogen III oxidase [Sporosarcina sp. P35]